MGINNILTAPDLFYDNKSLIDVHSQFAGLADMINIFANAPLRLLPILIGFSAAKRFGGNPFLGAALGMILVHPSLMSAYDFPKAVEAGKSNSTLGLIWLILIKWVIKDRCYQCWWQHIF